MRRFCALFDALDASTSTNVKVAAMSAYFRDVPAADAAWATYLLAGGSPRRVIPVSRLRTLACEAANITDAMFDDCYQMAGDLAETIAHLLPMVQSTDDCSLREWMEHRLMPMRGQAPDAQDAAVRAHWKTLDTTGRFIYVKLIGGGFRVGVAKGLVIRALANAFALDEKIIAQRMMGFTRISKTPNAADFLAIISQEGSASNNDGAPYPFFLAHPLKDPPESLGDLADWQIEWKYDGIRAQAVKRNGEVFLWSRGEELVNEAFPDVVCALCPLPDGTVIDGELLVWRDEAQAPFSDLQKRLGRKNVSKATLSKLPVVLLSYDCLEVGGRDLREDSLESRRKVLERIVLADGNAGTTRPYFPSPLQASDKPTLRDDLNHRATIKIAPLISVNSWQEAEALRAQARAYRTEGFMLKRKTSAYGLGRAGNAWWKWKLDPLTVDCVLTYAQRGHGRRAGLYTDYTFGVWTRAPRDADECAHALSMPPSQAASQNLPTIVTFAKAYSGLTDEEIKAIDKIVKQTVIEDFGPVRAVRPTIVMELGFEGMSASPRHKSGVAVRFPRILRIRADKLLHEADTLDTLMSLIQ